MLGTRFRLWVCSDTATVPENERALDAEGSMRSSTGKAVGGTIRPPPPRRARSAGRSSGLIRLGRDLERGRVQTDDLLESDRKLGPDAAGQVDDPRSWLPGNGERDDGLGEHAGSQSQHKGGDRERGRRI